MIDEMNNGWRMRFGYGWIIGLNVIAEFGLLKIALIKNKKNKIFH